MEKGLFQVLHHFITQLKRLVTFNSPALGSLRALREKTFPGANMEAENGGSGGQIRVLQQRGGRVPGGENGILDGPVHSRIRIIPSNAPFMFRGIEVGAFIEYFCLIAQNAETVGKMGRNIQALSVFPGKKGPDPFSKGG